LFRKTRTMAALIKTITHYTGRALRETGQRLNVLGYQAADDACFKDHWSRHRTVMSLFDQAPYVAPGVAFVAPCASVIGEVDIDPKSSVWYGAVLRGDANVIRVGANVNVQDHVVIKTTPKAPVLIGANVTIGHNAVLTSCTVGPTSLVGMGAVLSEGAVVEEGSMVAASAVVAPGTVVKSGQLWGGSPAVFLRDLKPEEKAQLSKQANAYAELAAQHSGAVAAL